MQAIILCAGVGSRLRPLTNHVPKCMVRVAGKPILQHQLESLAACGVHDITLVTGYRGEQVAQFVQDRFPELKIQLIENHDYATTNNMYSLYLARERLGQETLLLNGDIVFGPELLQRVLATKDHSVIATMQGVYVEESMKVVRKASGTLCAISKKLTAGESYGISLDLYRFSAETAQTLRDRILATIEGEKNLTQWTEVAIDAVLSDGAARIRPVDCNGLRWVEIDNFDDLQQAEVQFNWRTAKVPSKKAFFFDGDGTLYVDGHLLPGAVETLVALRKEKKQVFFLTNNSSRSKDEYVVKLAKLGLPFTREEIITSVDTTVDYLEAQAYKTIYVLAPATVVAEFERAGFAISAEDAQAVVLCYDTDLTYEKIRRASILIQKGAAFVATHSDKFCPTREGGIPDAGAFIAMLEATTGVSPVVLGKPNPQMIVSPLKRYGIPAEEAIHIGDRIHTDIQMGKRAGVDTVCVLTGEATREDIEGSAVRPDIILEDLRGLLRILGGRTAQH